MKRIYGYILFIFLILPWQNIYPKADFKYELAMCAIFRNEAPFLEEWIEFHLLMGVQHFYLYNNLSTDHYKKVLKPYLKKKQVTLIHWPFEYASLNDWNNIQCTAYRDAIAKARHQARWLAILDMDEFIFPVEKENLLEFLKNYSRFGGVCANWQMYGTSHVSKIPQDKLLIETLLMKAPKDYSDNNHVKSIVQPLRVRECRSPHFCFYLEGYQQVNENKEHFQWARSPYVSIDKIRINHYWTRDEDYFYTSKISRRSDWYGNVQRQINRLEALNTHPDDGAIQRFVPQLRTRIFNKREDHD